MQAPGVTSTQLVNPSNNKKSTRNSTLRLVLKLRRPTPTNNITKRNNGKKLNNSINTQSYNEEPMVDTFIELDDPSDIYNYGDMQIQISEKRAKFYLPDFIDYVKGIDNSLTVPGKDIIGLIIHFPNDKPMAFDPTTTFQYGMFPTIQLILTEINQPIMLITRNGFQEINADDVRGKYSEVLTKLFKGNDQENVSSKSKAYRSMPSLSENRIVHRKDKIISKSI
jgi:hypothetical protein